MKNINTFPPFPPGVSGLNTLFWLVKIRQNAAFGLMDLFKKYGDVVRIHYFGRTLILLSHPDSIRYVLQENWQNYRKSRIDKGELIPVMGKGLVNSEGELWKRQRLLIQPAFHTSAMPHFAKTMVSVTAEMLGRWSSPISGNVVNVVDVHREMNQLTMEIICRVLFGTDIHELFPKVSESLSVLMAFIVKRMTAPILPRRLSYMFHPHVRKSIRDFHTVVDTIIQKFHREGPSNHFLSLLMQARDPQSGQTMSDLELRDEVMTFLIAGSDTTAQGLTWVLHLLTVYPLVAEKMVEEIDTLLKGRLPTMEDVPQLVWTRMVIDESMRLFPPAWVFFRDAVENDQIGGYFIPKNAIIILSQYVTHRHPTFWEEPEAFRPARFSQENIARRVKGTYIPFGFGPRQCIGASFAVMEMVLVISQIFQKFRMEAIPGRTVDFLPQILLKPKNGLPLKLIRRPN